MEKEKNFEDFFVNWVINCIQKIKMLIKVVNHIKVLKNLELSRKGFRQLLSIKRQDKMRIKQIGAPVRWFSRSMAYLNELENTKPKKI
jgi:hypothetical protein